MRIHAALFGVVVLAAPALFVACKKKDAAPPGSPASYGYGYATPSASAPVSGDGPAAPPAAPPAASASGPLAAPGPAALPCTSDAMCLAHRCNVAVGRCAFPCETDGDCVPGNFCFKGAIAVCLAKPPGQASQ